MKKGAKYLSTIWTAFPIKFIYIYVTIAFSLHMPMECMKVVGRSQESQPIAIKAEKPKIKKKGKI